MKKTKIDLENNLIDLRLKLFDLIKEQNHEELCLFLKEKNELNVNFIWEDSNICPLQLAILVKSPKIVELLIKQGANVNFKPERRNDYISSFVTQIACNLHNTPLQMAIDLRNEEIISLLINAGACLLMKNMLDFNAIEMLVLKKDIELLEFIINLLQR